MKESAEKMKAQKAEATAAQNASIVENTAHLNKEWDAKLLKSKNTVEGLRSEVVALDEEILALRTSALGDSDLNRISKEALEENSKIKAQIAAISIELEGLKEDLEVSRTQTKELKGGNKLLTEENDALSKVKEEKEALNLES